MFTIRFDMRAPSFGAPASELYAAAIDMCAWAETRGAIVAVLSEHHGAEDGHLYYMRNPRTKAAGPRP